MYKDANESEMMEKFVERPLNCGKPISIIDKNVIYAKSSEVPGAINRVTLNGTSRPDIKPLNIGIEEPIAVFRVPLDPKVINKPAGCTFDLVLGSDCRKDAIVLCTSPGPESQTQALPA